MPLTGKFYFEIDLAGGRNGQNAKPCANKIAVDTDTGDVWIGKAAGSWDRSPFGRTPA